MTGSGTTSTQLRVSARSLSFSFIVAEPTITIAATGKCRGSLSLSSIALSTDRSRDATTRFRCSRSSRGAASRFSERDLRMTGSSSLSLDTTGSRRACWTGPRTRSRRSSSRWKSLRRGIVLSGVTSTTPSGRRGQILPQLTQCQWTGSFSISLHTFIRESLCRPPCSLYIQLIGRERQIPGPGHFP